MKEPEGAPHVPRHPEDDKATQEPGTFRGEELQGQSLASLVHQEDQGGCEKDGGEPAPLSQKLRASFLLQARQRLA